MAKQRDEAIDVRIVADHVDEEPEVSELVTRLEAEADREIAAGSITLRWGRDQIAVVKRAAALMGVPYQTYLKQVVFSRPWRTSSRLRRSLATAISQAGQGSTPARSAMARPYLQPPWVERPEEGGPKTFWGDVYLQRHSQMFQMRDV